MSEWQTWTDDQHREWREWLVERPPEVRALAERFPPYKLFKMQDTGQRVYVISYNENGTLSVAVTSEFNFVTFARNVFGINPANLTECELPGKDELCGSLLTTDDEVESFLDAFKAAKAQDTN